MSRACEECWRRASALAANGVGNTADNYRHLLDLGKGHLLDHDHDGADDV